MQKTEERNNPRSCWNKAADGERMFILLSRDPIAPKAIRHWCQERVMAHLNTWDDAQIQEALNAADLMEAEGARKR